jgi:Flp pilus assembly protein TadD
MLRALSILPLIAALATPWAIAQRSAPRDAYEPSALDEFALERLREGDVRTASILLERAARLAPNDARIRAHLRALPAIPEERGADAAARDPVAKLAPTGTLLPEPPALWPRR